MKTPGEILRRAREKRGWSIEEASIATCISKTHILHLEQDRFEEFQDVFARGFIRNYARELGCDPFTVIRAFDRLRAQTRERNPAPLEKKTKIHKKNKKQWLHLSLAIAFILALLTGIGLIASSQAIAEDPASFEKSKNVEADVAEEVRKTRWLLEQPENDPDRLIR